jgi:hypothetical protein
VLLTPEAAFAAEPHLATVRGHRNTVGTCLGTLAALALLTACGSGSGPPAQSGHGPTQTGSSHSGGQASACRGSDPAATIRAASAAQNSATSYQLVNTSSTQLGNTHLTVQVQQPDRFHYTAVTPDGHTSEFLSIGHTVWRKSLGAWAVASPNLDLGSMVKQAGGLGAGIANGGTFTDPSVDPNATLGGQAAVLHKFHVNNGSEQLDADVQLWLASDSCRPLQAIESFAQTSNGATSTGRSTTTWSGWDAVTIEAPE